jgi:uncharacterized membrane protein
MSDTHIKSIAKGITWRIVGTLDTFLLSWIVTGHAKTAASIASIELVSKVMLYWAHERVWIRFSK